MFVDSGVWCSPTEPVAMSRCVGWLRTAERGRLAGTRRRRSHVGGPGV